MIFGWLRQIGDASPFQATVTRDFSGAESEQASLACLQKHIDNTAKITCLQAKYLAHA